jgi:GNAT superfamily N-acetyltransferase
MSTEYDINIVDAWPEEDIIKLYKAGGWWKEHYSADSIGGIIEGSFAFAVAVTETGKAVGMGRVIADGVSDAWIQDVAVLQGWRGLGIGHDIIRTLLDHCVRNGFCWIGLVAEPGTKEFYTPLGFKELAGEPMVFEPEV